MDTVIAVTGMLVVVALLAASTYWDVFERDSHLDGQIYRDPHRHR